MIKGILYLVQNYLVNLFSWRTIRIKKLFKRFYKYRGLPYLFEVRRQKFRNDCQILRSQPQNLEAKCHSTSTTLKGLSENLKKMSWHNPVSPIDAKNSIPFLYNFFWVSLELQVIVISVHPKIWRQPKSQNFLYFSKYYQHTS